MEKIMMLATISVLSFSLYGCSAKPDIDKVKEEADIYIEDSDLSKYIVDVKNNVSYSYKDLKDGDKDYTINIKVIADESFNDLETLEQFNVLKQTTQHVNEEATLPSCGKADCQFGKLIVEPLTVYTAIDTYTMDIDNPYDKRTMVWNDEKYTEDDLFSYKENEVDEDSTETTTDSTDTTTSSTIDEYTKDAVYAYMQDLYDQVTNDGENYIPEIHDPQVAQAAAERFDITEEEAGQIYVDKEVEKADNY